MGSPFKFQTILTGQTIIDRIQANIQNAFNSIVGPFLGGVMLTAQKIATTPTQINHGLGRTPQLWTIADQDTLATVKRISWDQNTITLQASADCTISLSVN